MLAKGREMKNTFQIAEETQLTSARKGVVTDEMEHVARREKLAPELRTSTRGGRLNANSSA